MDVTLKWDGASGVQFHPASEKPTKPDEYLVYGVTDGKHWRAQVEWSETRGGWMSCGREHIQWWAEIPRPPGWVIE